MVAHCSWRPTMPPPSLARNFFDEIRNAPDSVAFIRGLVNSTPPTFETDWLDFKEQPRINAHRVADLSDKKWRDIWIEALAGFANNQGGVLIWGIEARKDAATGIDAAADVKPVNNPNAVKSRLTELQRQATDPPLTNVEIDAYELPTAPGTGFVVCFVPEGPFKPYKTEDGRRSQYVIRAGDNFVAMSRSMLQSMFYPRTKAVFRVKATLVFHLPERNRNAEKATAHMNCIVELANDGTATARNVEVFVTSHLTAIAGTLQYKNGPIHWVMYTVPGGPEFHSHNPVHPGKQSEMFTTTWLV